MWRNLRKRIGRYWIALSCVFILSMYFLVVCNTSVHDESIKKPQPVRRKLILDWTTFFGQRLVNSPTLEEMGCDVTSCEYTNDRSQVEDSDTVMFHWNDIDLKDMPKKGDRQRWILKNYESPFRVSSQILESLKDSFDWTVSYRSDSDIPSYYGLVRSRKATDPSPVAAINRTSFAQRKAIAWMTSDCGPQSKRDFLTSELERFIDVDIYGTCHGGDLSLRRISTDLAFRNLSERYKLYLSFENALCRDYATEKVFVPLHYGLIPVVWGGANYSQILPPNSYIDVKNFSTIKDLASHLKKVIEDYDVYASYFEWRKEYFVQDRNIRSTYMCDLCAKLYSDQVYNVKLNVSLTSWWNLDSDCVRVPNPPFTLPPLRESITALYKKQ